MHWRQLVDALEGERLPAALVDLDAVDRNVDRVLRAISGRGKSLRVASKSIRHVGLLRRVLERGGDIFRGVMSFSLEEAAFLIDEGFDDILVAYPCVDRHGLAPLARRVADGALVRLMADDVAQLDAYAAAAVDAGTELEVMLDLDLALRPGGRVHVGVYRSSLRTPADILRIARAADRIDGVRVVGLMGYEAHVAGLPDANPFSRAMNPARRALKRVAVPAVARARRRGVAALRDHLEGQGRALSVVNGGGTGSLDSTSREADVTEVTAGSGFLCSHLFDYYEGNELEPAAFFALEVCRIPEAGVVTCLGGGYVASGEPGWDRLPVPHLPEGCSYLPMEGAGEVQTPLRLGPTAPRLRIGEPVIFRHAKAGELAERFSEYLLIRDGEVVAREPTYRGQGQCFL